MVSEQLDLLEPESRDKFFQGEDFEAEQNVTWNLRWMLGPCLPGFFPFLSSIYEGSLILRKSTKHRGLDPAAAKYLRTLILKASNFL